MYFSSMNRFVFICYCVQWMLLFFACICDVGSNLISKFIFLFPDDVMYVASTLIRVCSRLAFYLIVWLAPTAGRR